MSNLEASHYNIIKHGKSATFQDAYFYFYYPTKWGQDPWDPSCGEEPYFRGTKSLVMKKEAYSRWKKNLTVEPLAFWWETSSQPASNHFFTPTKGDGTQGDPHKWEEEPLQVER